MPLTPETLPRHELNGLQVEIVDAHNPDLVGISGRVVRETTRTLHVRGADGRSRVVPKSGSTFEFALYNRASGHATDEAALVRKTGGTASKRPSETAGRTDVGESPTPDAGQSGGPAGDSPAANRTPSGDCEGVAYVTVDGARLLSRPARRTETGGVSKWH